MRSELYGRSRTIFRAQLHGFVTMGEVPPRRRRGEASCGGRTRQFAGHGLPSLHRASSDGDEGGPCACTSNQRVTTHTYRHTHETPFSHSYIHTHTRSSDTLECLAEFKHFWGPWWLRWVPFRAKTASEDLVKAACTHYKLFSAPPLLLYAESELKRAVQLPMGCMLTSVNHLLSPRDGCRDGIPIHVMKAYATATLYSELASGAMWESDFLAAMKRVDKSDKLGLFSFQDIKMLLVQSSGGQDPAKRLTFSPVDIPRRKVPLNKPSKVMCHCLAFFLLDFGFSAAPMRLTFSPIPQPQQCGRFLLVGVSKPPRQPVKRKSLASATGFN